MTDYPNVLKAIDEGKISWPVASRIISQLEMTPQASFLIYLLENKITTEDAARIAFAVISMTLSTRFDPVARFQNRCGLFSANGRSMS